MFLATTDDENSLYFLSLIWVFFFVQCHYLFLAHISVLLLSFLYQLEAFTSSWCWCFLGCVLCTCPCEAQGAGADLMCLGKCCERQNYTRWSQGDSSIQGGQGSFVWKTAMQPVSRSEQGLAVEEDTLKWRWRWRWRRAAHARKQSQWGGRQGLRRAAGLEGKQLVGWSAEGWSSMGWPHPTLNLFWVLCC